MAVQQKDDTNKHTLSGQDASPSTHKNRSVKSDNSGKNDGTLS